MGYLEQAFQENVIDYLESFNRTEVKKLALFLGGGYMKTNPDKKQQEFIREFIGDLEYAEFYRINVKNEKAYFTNAHITGVKINELYSYVSFYYINLPTPRIRKNDKLKKDLAKAIQDSYFDDVFDKVEGFCNIADVLRNHKLITI